MKRTFSSRYRTIAFHIFLWGIWLYLSVSSVSDEEAVNKAIIMSSLILFTHIPLFVINTEWLIPRILNKHGVSIYFWILMGFVLAFGIIHSFVFTSVHNYLGLIPKYRSPLKGIVPLIVVAAISTGYGLLSYIAEQEQQQQEKQQQHLQAELSFLRSQISPHFIFNILNSIVYLIRVKSDLAEPVTLKLSELMRYMLYETETDQISLEKELAYLTNYIALQKIRFEEDVDIRFEVKGTPTSQMIEPMLLIPFVENAFKHGVGMLSNPVIIIDLEIKEQSLTFTVKNKIAPETAMSKDNSSGIGLKNVQRRLELLYEHAHQLDIVDKDGDFNITLNLTFN